MWITRIVSMILLATLAPVIPAQEKPLRNEDIIQMTKAGLDEDTIIKAIEANDSAFDTSAEGLLALKNAGVSESIIQAILKAATKKQAPEPSTSAAGEPSAFGPVDKPNFTGHWKMDKARSTFRASKGQTPNSGFAEVTLSVDHQEPNLTMVITFKGQRQGGVTQTYRFTTNGAEAESDLGNGSRFKSQSEWKGKLLSYTGKYSLKTPKGSFVEGRETGSFSLSDDSNTLVSDTHARIQKRERWEKLVFARQ